MAKNILEEALEITQGDRQDDYGSPLDQARIFADLARAATGLDIQPIHYPLLMICVKLSRARQTPGKRDHWTDIAGYSWVATDIYEKAAAELEELDLARRRAIVNTGRNPDESSSDLSHP
jgi:hypothetical protein